MTTAAMTSAKAPAETDSPVGLDAIASALYGTEPATKADPPAETQTPEPEPERDSSPQAEKADATPPVEDKTEEPSKGSEDKGGDLKEQLSNQTAANRRLGRELSDLRRQMNQLAEENKTLQSKLDGTYKEPPKETPEQAAKRAAFKEREAISQKVAESLFGADAMEAKVYGEKSVWNEIIAAEQKAHDGDSPTLRSALYDEQPAVAAMRAVQRYEFTKKYGDDPAKWVEAIVAEHKPKIIEEIKKQLGKPPVGQTTVSVTEGRGAGDGSKRERSLADRIYG
jgi:regulator of replication initiation timing